MSRGGQVGLALYVAAALVAGAVSNELRIRGATVPTSVVVGVATGVAAAMAWATLFAALPPPLR